MEIELTTTKIMLLRLNEFNRNVLKMAENKISNTELFCHSYLINILTKRQKIQK